MSDKNIGSLPAAASIEDDSLLVAEQQGEAVHFTGKQLKDYAKSGVNDLVMQARFSAEQAAESAKKAASTAESIEDIADDAQAAIVASKAAQVAKEDAEQASVSAITAQGAANSYASAAKAQADRATSAAQTAATTAAQQAAGQAVSQVSSQLRAEVQSLVNEAGRSAAIAQSAAKTAAKDAVASAESNIAGYVSAAENAKEAAENASFAAEAAANSINQGVTGAFEKFEELGGNRLNPESVTTGYYVNPNNGALATNSSYSTTDFIPVFPGEIITYQYGALTVREGRTLGTMSFLAAYDENKAFLSGGRDKASYEVPEGVAFIRFSANALSTASNVAVVASAEKMDFEPYRVTERYVLKPEAHDDEHIREIVDNVVGDFDFESSKVWAAPIVVGVAGKYFEIDSPADGESFPEVRVPEGSAATSIKVWGKNHFNNEKGAAVTANGVTITWDAENQEMVFNGTTTAGGDWKIVNPFPLDWVAGETYSVSVRQVGGTATLGSGSATTTYAWGIFQDNAAKYVRGLTYLTSFDALYSFTATAFALDANRSNILYFQCWRPGTVFNNYRVKLQIEKGKEVTEWEPYRGKIVAIEDAPKQTLGKGKNYIKAMPSGDIIVGQIEDTKTYVDSVAGIKSVPELPDIDITNAYDKDNTGYEAKKFLWNGGVSDNTAYFATNFIKVEPDTDYAFFGSENTPMVRSICEYNESQAFISGMSHQNVVTIHTTASTHFLRVCCYNGAENSLTVRKGTMATGYTPRNSYKVPGKMVSQDANAIDAYLPKNIYCAVGRTIELYNSQVCLQADKYHMKWSCPVGKALKRKFSITGTETLIGDYTLKLGIYNDRLEEVWAGSTTLHIVDWTKDGLTGIVPIGDSLTNSKVWLPEVVNLVGENSFGGDALQFLGSYAWRLKDADGNERSGGHDGRSGFTAEAYIKGATYSFGGETKPNAFWDGEKFNWRYYMEGIGLADMGVVNGVMIFLGTNGIQNDNTQNAGYIKQMVDAIRADEPSLKVFVCNTIYRSNQNGIGVQVGNDGYAATSGVWKYNEDKKVMDLMQRLDAMLDGYENVWMVNLALTHDSENNFGAVETPVNPRATKTEYLPIESVHPQNQGYYQMADTMYSVMCAGFAEGTA